MTIDDELMLKLTQPDDSGKVPLHTIVKIKEIIFQIEERVLYRLPPQVGEWKIMIPDLLVTIAPHAHTDKQKKIAIELENDVKWDFADSLRQMKLYKMVPIITRKTEVIGIIPKVYERFVPLYNNEGIPIWLWSATRIWECMNCGELTEKQLTAKPKCSNKDCRSNELRLSGLKDVKFESTQDKTLIIQIP